MSRMNRRTVASAVFTLLILISTVPSGGTAAAAAEANGSQTPGPVVETSLQRDGAVLAYDLAVDRLSDGDRLTLVVGTQAEIERVEGFERVSTEGRTRLRWDGTTATPRVVLRTGAGEAADEDRKARFYATERWMLAPVPYLRLQWTGPDGTTRLSRPLADGAVTDTDRARVGTRYALVGEHDTARASAAGQSFELVSPRGTETGPDRAAVLSALGTAADHLRVKSRDDRVLMFALPAPARGGEAIPARAEAWVRADAPLADPDSVWLHEYVHTRQSLHLASDMRWFREASAEYYAARLAHRGGMVSRAAAVAHLDGQESEAALTRPDTWENPRVPYRKGSRVLAALDYEIRAATDGDRTLQDVFRRLNEHEGRIDYATFSDTVTAVAGTPMDAWLDRHVAGSAPAPDHYPDVGSTDGTTDPREGGTAGPVRTGGLLAALASPVAAATLYGYLTRGTPGPGIRRRTPE